MILNFGILEVLSYTWIRVLAKDEIIFDLALDMQFARRVDLITQLIDKQDLPAELVKAAKAIWSETKPIAELRNTVAHNPLVFGWHGPERPEAPDFIGLPNLKSIKGKMPRITPLTTLAKLNATVDKVSSLAPRIEKLIDEIEAARHHQVQTGQA